MRIKQTQQLSETTVKFARVTNVTIKKRTFKLRKIQTKQSNERTVKFAQDAKKKKIKMKEKFNRRDISVINKIKGR